MYVGHIDVTPVTPDHRGPELSDELLDNYRKALAAFGKKSDFEEATELKELSNMLKVHDPRQLGKGRDVKSPRGNYTIRTVEVFLLNTPELENFDTQKRGLTIEERKTSHEPILLHGSDPEAIVSILKDYKGRFIPSGIVGDFGPGAYFATHFEKFDQYVRKGSKNESITARNILITRIIWEDQWPPSLRGKDNDVVFGLAVKALNFGLMLYITSFGIQDEEARNARQSGQKKYPAVHVLSSGPQGEHLTWTIGPLKAPSAGFGPLLGQIAFYTATTVMSLNNHREFVKKCYEFYESRKESDKGWRRIVRDAKATFPRNIVVFPERYDEVVFDFLPRDMYEGEQVVPWALLAYTRT